MQKHNKMKNTKYKFILLLVAFVAFICVNFCYSSDDETKIPDWLKRIYFGVEVGTGQKPRIYFETVQPLYQDLDKQNTFFIHPRYLLESEESTYNLGLGYRRLFKDNSALIGANTYFDFEDDDKHYRIGFGLETFINQIEFRANSYIGLSPQRLVNETSTGKIYEKAVDGFDGEIGLPFPYMNWVKLYAGGYWYNYEKFSNKEGWKIRTEMKPFTFQTINFIVYDDNKGDTAYRVDIRVTIPFETFYGKTKDKICNIGFSNVAYPEKADHSSRVLDRVEREYKIEVEKWLKTATATIEIKRGN